jgi:hypothetical protein
VVQFNVGFDQFLRVDNQVLTTREREQAQEQDGKRHSAESAHIHPRDGLGACACITARLRHHRTAKQTSEKQENDASACGVAWNMDDLSCRSAPDTLFILPLLYYWQKYQGLLLLLPVVRARKSERQSVCSLLIY